MIHLRRFRKSNGQNPMPICKYKFLKKEEKKRELSQSERQSMTTYNYSSERILSALPRKVSGAVDTEEDASTFSVSPVFFSFFFFLKTENNGKTSTGARESSVVKTTVCACSKPGSVHRTHMVLHNSLYPHSRGFGAPFWPPQAPANVVHRSTYRPSTHTERMKFKTKKDINRER